MMASTTPGLQGASNLRVERAAAERQHPPIQIVAYRSCKLDVQ